MLDEESLAVIRETRKFLQDLSQEHADYASACGPGLEQDGFTTVSADCLRRAARLKEVFGE